MEAMKTEQDGAAISDLEQFMVGNVAWDTMVQIPKTKHMNNPKDEEMHDSPVHLLIYSYIHLFSLINFLHSIIYS